MASATALHARAMLAPRSDLRPLVVACALACAAVSAQAQQTSLKVFKSLPPMPTAMRP